MPSFLKNLLQSLTESTTAGDAREMNLQLATAALLIEMMRADHSVSPAEEAALRAALRQEFSLDESALEALIADAGQEARHAAGFFAFTREINTALPIEDKLRVMEYLWRIALADGEIAAHENHLMRKLADLIHVGHGDYHAAKARAAEHLRQRS